MKTTIQLIAAILVVTAFNVWSIFYATPARRSLWFGHQIEQKIVNHYSYSRKAISADSIIDPLIIPGDFIIDTDTAILTYVWYRGEIVFHTMRGTRYYCVNEYGSWKWPIQWCEDPLDSAKAQCWREAERWIESETKEPDSLTWIRFRFDSVTMITDTDTFRTKPTLIPTHD